jgi:hypothetical protein
MLDKARLNRCANAPSLRFQTSIQSFQSLAIIHRSGIIDVSDHQSRESGIVQ